MKQNNIQLYIFQKREPNRKKASEIVKIIQRHVYIHMGQLRKRHRDKDPYEMSRQSGRQRNKQKWRNWRFK